jgi:hypothetical protein
VIRIRGLRKEAIERASVGAEACLQALGVANPSALLILGHMRSGSTLLLHLLMTNPEIAALGERGAVYASKADLARLAVAARLARGSPFRPLRYVADQVNHNNLTPNTSLLRDARVKIAFLLRRPQPSIASIVELYRAHYREPWSVSRAVDYYVQRLGALMRLGESLPNPGCAALTTYEMLTESPQDTLDVLRKFLGLPRGFTQTYRTYPFTGTYGDPGPHISAGRIVRKEPTADIPMSVSELERSTQAYDRCSSALARFALRV